MLTRKSVVCFGIAMLMSMSLWGCSTWRGELNRELEVMGHRNWIVIADSAYPCQSSPGIKTIVTGADHIEVVQEVLAAVERAPHVRPVVYTDSELPVVAETDAPGIENYRRRLAPILAGQTTHSLSHEEIIRRLDQASRLFNILILKTDMTMPYTSVFVELDCGYWSGDAQERLERNLGKQAKQ